MPSNALGGSCLVLILLLCYLTLVPALFSLGKDDAYGAFLAGRAKDVSVNCLGRGCAGTRRGVYHGVSIAPPRQGPSDDSKPARVYGDVTIDVRTRSSRSAIRNIAASSARSIITISTGLRESLSTGKLPSNAQEPGTVSSTSSIDQEGNDRSQFEIPHSSPNRQSPFKSAQKSSPSSFHSRFYTHENFTVFTSSYSSQYDQQAHPPPTPPSTSGPLFKLIHTFLAPSGSDEGTPNLSREKEIQGSCLGLIIGVIFGVLCF